MIVRCPLLAAGLLGLSVAGAFAQSAPPPTSTTEGCFEDLVGEGQGVLGLSVQYPEQRILVVRAWSMAVAGSTLKITQGGGTCSQAQAVNNAFPVKLAVTCVRVIKPGEVTAVSVELTPAQEGMINAVASCDR